MTPLEIVRSFIAAVERRDLDTALALVTDDVEYDNVPMASVHGPEGVRGVLAPFLERAAEVEWVVRREAATGDLVFNERLDRFRVGDSWIEIAVAGVWEVRDGKITLWRDYFDLEQYRSQLT
jgi:limonene-1,2-epoxide hydrolase